MSVIIRLQNLPLTASAMDIRVFFHGLAIPDGGVHIVGGKHGDAFIAFSSDEDARQAMNLSGEQLKECTIKLLLSSRNEMFKVIEQARQPMGIPEQTSILSTGIPTNPQNLQNNGTISSSLGESTGMNTSGPTNPSLDQSSSNLNPLNNNSLPNVNMTMGAFTPGLNLGLPTNGMNPFQNMKLTPQQLNSLVTGVGMFSQQSTATVPTGMGQPQNNSFMLPNMPFGVGGANQSMLHANPFAEMSTGIIPHGMLPGMMNQQPPQLPPNPNPAQPVGHLPPFQQNQPHHGMRPGGMNPTGNLGQPNLGFGNTPNPNILHDPNIFHPGLQQNNGTGRQNFNQTHDVDNLNRNRFNQNPIDISKVSAPEFRQNAGSTPVEPNRDRGVNPNRERIGRERDRDLDREKQRVGEKGGRRRSMSLERKNTAMRPNDRRKRSRSRSRDRERPRRDGNRSRSRSPSRPRPDSAARPTSGGRRNSVRSDGNDPDVLIIDESSGSACLMLSNVPNEASYRDVREFLRADARLYGVMRDYEKGTACIRLDNPSDLDRVLRHDGRKLQGNPIRVEAVPLQVFEQHAKKYGAPVDPNRARGNPRDFGDKERPADFNERDRGRDRDIRSREREREPRHHGRGSGECCLIINGLPVTFSGADVANMTLDGIVKHHYSDIHIHEEPVDRQGRQFATAFVKFYSVAEAEKTIAFLANTQGHLRAHVTEIEELQRIRQGILPSPRKMDHDAKPLFDMDLGMAVSCNVMLKGVPLNMTERDVFDFFSDIGLSPKRVKLLSDANTGNRISKIVCEFNEVAQAREAVTKNGHFFGRSAIGVRMLPRREPGLPAGDRSGILGNRPTSTFTPPQHARFQPSQNDSENPFVQALNAAGGGPPMGTDHPMRGNPRGGMRGRGLVRGRGGTRPSRFAPADSTTNDSHHHNAEKGNPPSYFERKGCVLALSNIPFSADMDQIIQFLEETLEKNVPHDRIIRRYNEFQKPTGDARVAFNSPFETMQALKRLNGSRMWGRTLEVSILNEF